MAEAAAIVSLINACIGLTKEIINIGQAAKDAHGLPENLAHLFEQLPPLQHLFEKAKENNDKLDPTLRNNARPVLKQCEEAFQQLEALFKDLCPEDGANPAKRIWKGASAAIFGKNTKLQKLWKQIEGYLNTLEKQEIFIIGDALSGLKDAVELLAKDGEGVKFTHHGCGNQNVTEKGGTSFNTGGGNNNNYTFHNQGARYNSGGGNMQFGKD